ncbi:hypothetical protein ACFQ0T_00025 [Kitasatospora gansuensis]
MEGTGVPASSRCLMQPADALGVVLQPQKKFGYLWPRGSVRQLVEAPGECGFRQVVVRDTEGDVPVEVVVAADATTSRGA